MNLYEINEAIEAAYLQAIDQETGEVNEEALAALDQLEMERDRKVEYIACLIKNLRAEAAALKAEKDAFAKRQKQTENHVEGLSRYLQAVLNGEKFTSDRCAVTFRRSTRVELDPGKTVFDIDASYWRLKDPELDKTALARALKDGAEISGVHLEEGLSMTVK